MNRHLRERLLEFGLSGFRMAVAAMMFLGHGWGKFTGFMEGADSFPDPLGVGPVVSLGLAVFAEAGCAVLVFVGYKTRLAVIPLVFTMVVAAFVIHGADPWGDKEMAVLYALCFGMIGLTGPGQFSADRFIQFLRASS